MTYIARSPARSLAIFIVLASLWLGQPVAYAQDNQPPFLDIVNVDRSQAPTVQLSLVGSNLTGELNTLPLKLSEGEQAQAIASDRTARVGLQLAFVIDPGHILAPGRSGQTHHTEVSHAVLDLIENKVITRNVDTLAVYTTVKADGALQTIQDWTKEPNLIFNSIVQHKPEEIGEAPPLTELLVQALASFQTSEPSAQLTRSLLLFSSGASPFDRAAVVAKANEGHVFIHVVDLAGADPQASQTAELQQLAQQTHGQYIFLETAQNLAALSPILNGLRTQRTLSYQSSSAAPAPLKVTLTLPNGAPVEATFLPADPATGAVQAAQATTGTVTTANASTTNPAVTNSVATDTTTANTTTINTATANVPAGAALASTETVAAVATTDSTAPATAGVAGVDIDHSDQVMIPGLAIAVPRMLLQLALPVLILLLAYFIYRDVRERRARAGQNINLNRRLNSRDSQLYALKDPVSDLKPLPKNKAKAGDYELQTDDDLPVQVAEPLSTPRYTPRKNEYQDEDDQNDDATIVPRPSFGDDEATYRLSEQIEQPIIGAFVRVAGNPTLPNEVPIYGLNPARGEARHIHIGRHSKNNTVVINDKSISREHAVIVQKEGRLYLRDNASTAGTFLNGKRLQPGEELLLRHNDLVSFGEVVYEFHAKGEDEATVAGE